MDNNMHKDGHPDGFAIAKGIGIILVVFGHALTDDMADMSLEFTYLRYTVYLLHMPLFFIVSGYLFECNKQKYTERGFRKFAAAKGRLLMVPYLSFSAIIWGISLIASQIGPFEKTFQNAGYTARGIGDFLFSLVTYVNPIDNHLWFSYVLFVVFLLSFITKKIAKKYMLPVAWAGYALSFLVPFPELIWKTMRYFFLFQAGTVLFQKKYCLNNKKYYVLAGILFVIGYGCFCVFRFLQLSTPQIFVQPVAEIMGSILIVLFSFHIRDAYVGKCLQWFGTMSYQIYLLHQPFVVPILVLIMRGRIPMLLMLIIATISGLLIPIGLYRGILSKEKNIKFLLFGKRE